MSGERIVIRTDKAPAAVGPYEQGIRWQQLVFTAGQIPKDPVTGQLHLGSIKEQTRAVLENLRAVLEAGGSSLAKVLKVTVYLKVENGVVQDVRFDGAGCAISTASASLMTERFKGLSEAEAALLASKKFEEGK